MNNKVRVDGWLDDIKDEVERIGSYDLDDHIQVLKQMIEDLQKFIKEDC
jgi:cell division septum initiation protein DivIVA